MTLVAHSRPYRAIINEALVDDHEIVAAVTGKRIVVVNMVVAVESGQTITWKNGNGGAALSGDIASSYTAGDAHSGLLETTTGVGLFLALSAATAVDGHLTYVLLG